MEDGRTNPVKWNLQSSILTNCPFVSLHRYTGLRLLHIPEAVQSLERLPAGRPDGQRAATAAATCHAGWGLWRPQSVRVGQRQQQPAQLQPQHHWQQLNALWTTGGTREPRRSGGHSGQWGSAGECVRTSLVSSWSPARSGRLMSFEWFLQNQQLQKDYMPCGLVWMCISVQWFKMNQESSKVQKKTKPSTHQMYFIIPRK